MHTAGLLLNCAVSEIKRGMIGRRNVLKKLTAAMLARPLADFRFPSSVPAHPSEKQVLRLDLNENAYGPSPGAIAAIRDHASSANRFPHSADSLRDSLSISTGVPAEQIMLSAGTDEILRMSVAAFLGPQRKLVMATPSYGAIAAYAKSAGARVITVPLRKDHGHNLERMLASADGSTGVVYVCNPNNPTGTLSDRHELENFVQALPPSILLVIDEAYHEYAGTSKAYSSAIANLAKRENLVVTRTFSKVYGLAGLRLGFAVCRPAVLGRLASQKLTLGVNEFALLAAIAAVQDKSHIERCVRQNQDDRQEFINQVNARMLRVLDSHTNFACLNVMRPSREIIEHYKKNNVILDSEVSNMPNYVRVSLGLPQEMAKFWRVWDLLGSHPMAM